MEPRRLPPRLHMSSRDGVQVQNAEGATMKIRIGDRVRTTRPGNRDSGLWGTVVRKMTRYVGCVPAIYLVWLDDGGGATIYNTEDFEKLPRYRGIPQARDTETAMRHLQEYMR